jgi:hypothetical protein
MNQRISAWRLAPCSLRFARPPRRSSRGKFTAISKPAKPPEKEEKSWP